MPPRELVLEVDAAISIYERASGHYAQATREMIKIHGRIETLSRLAKNAKLQHGFKILRDQDKLEQTFEAIIVRYPNEFCVDVVEAAQWRLDNANNLQ